MALASVVTGDKLGYGTGDPVGSPRSFVGGGAWPHGDGEHGRSSDVIRAVLVRSHFLPDGRSRAKKGVISGGVDFDKLGTHSYEDYTEGNRFGGVLFRGDFLERRSKIAATFDSERGHWADDYQ